jgi:hypothetical protein
MRRGHRQSLTVPSKDNFDGRSFLLCQSSILYAGKERRTSITMAICCPSLFLLQELHQNMEGATGLV